MSGMRSVAENALAQALASQQRGSGVVQLKHIDVLALANAVLLLADQGDTIARLREVVDDYEGNDEQFIADVTRVIGDQSPPPEVTRAAKNLGVLLPFADPTLAAGLTERARAGERRRIGDSYRALRLEAVQTGRGDRARLVSLLDGGGEVDVPRLELEDFMRALNGEPRQGAAGV